MPGRPQPTYKPRNTALGDASRERAINSATIDPLAMWAIILFPFGIVPMILGFIAHGRCQRTGRGGKGLAIAAMILGMITTIFWMAFIVAILHFWLGLGGEAATLVLLG
ncbi:MAG: DUF4190 domain-containing protein [Promicromonosporaceae bacterium]|nr:DUF4190 domain-containing protein [Promicromonosporaceae bacterium]